MAPRKQTGTVPSTRVKKSPKGKSQKNQSLQGKKQKSTVKKLWNVRCPICFNNLGCNDKGVSSTACGHVFCTSCLQKALLEKNNCPTCRKALTGIRCYHPIYLDRNCTDSTNNTYCQTQDIPK